jgi:CHAT domain
MVARKDVKQLFAQAVALYNRRKLAEAAALFRKVAAAGGELAAQARLYLARIAAKHADAKLAGRKRKAVKRAKTTKSAKSRGGAKRKTARKTASPKTAKRAKAPARLKAKRARAQGLREIRPHAPPLDRRIKKISVTPEPKPSIAPEIVRRTPHMDIRRQAPLEPRAAFDVEVFVDQEAAHPGEEVMMDVEVPAGTRVQVFLIASEHFLINGPTVQPMIIDAAPRSDAPPFHLTVKPAAEMPSEGSPHLSALFLHKGRPCGMVRRAVEILGVVAQALPPSPARFEMRPTKDADLKITVVAAEEKDGRKFFCIVSTPHLPDYREGVKEPWILPDVTEKLVHGYMKEFTAKNATPSERIASLRGAGLQLFDASPKVFQKVFWKLIDDGPPIKDIAIVSEEPFIPWELMIPNRPKQGGGRVRRDPLGREFRIGRWTDPTMRTPPQRLKLIDSYVIAPDYDVRKLEYAKEEADFVVTEFDGESIVPARFADIERKLKVGCRTLVHFVAHGGDSEAGTQMIYLDNNEKLTSTSVEGMDGIEDTFQKINPIVFLNACEVGRPAPALVGLGGFAASFIRLGASAVIAPLWSVEDSIAHQIAVEFYKRVKDEPETPFAEIFCKIREKAYDIANGKDTYAAYCFYGDPAAFAVRE